MLPPDFKELLSVLNNRRVRYLLIGGYVVSLHAQPRATKNLDIAVSPRRENALALYAALTEFGAPLAGLTAEDFMESGSFFRIGTPPLMIDILPSMVGIDFDAAWERRDQIQVDSTTGLRASVISRPDLIAVKLAAGRKQDLADVEALRKAQQE